MVLGEGHLSGITKQPKNSRHSQANSKHPNPQLMRALHGGTCHKILKLDFLILLGNSDDPLGLESLTFTSGCSSPDL